MRRRTPLWLDAERLLLGYRPATDQQVEVRDRFLALLAGDTDPTRQDHPGAHVTASGLVVDAALERVLLCLHGRVGLWVPLGGHCEDGDPSVAMAARREADEESGIDGLAIHPEAIDLDIHPVPCRHGECLHYDVRFALLAPPGARYTVSSESKALGWFRPDAMPQPLAGDVDRLVDLALRRAGELRDGLAVG